MKTENRKSKSLHSIAIENYSINTTLRYNINTTHIEIRTVFKYQDPNKTKKYRENNRENSNKYAKQYRDDHRDPNIPIFGSLEDRINRSCTKRKIEIKDFNGFTRPPVYCKLWTNKFKQLIRNRYHNKCFLCNTTKKDNNNRKLSVHHVNYDKNCLCGNQCEFVPLCSKCHTKTNFNRKYWEDLIMNYLYPERYFMVEI